MERALVEARKSLECGQFPVGAVIVCDNEIIASGFNQVELQSSDLAHAELLAMSSVEKTLFGKKRQCEIFTTLEPCFMCFGAMAHFRFKRLVVAARDELAGALGQISGLPYYGNGRIEEIVTGVYADESKTLIKAYTEATGFRTQLLSAIK